MRQDPEKYLMFSNRLEKVYRHLKRQADRQGVGCYRIYDHDIPEFPFLVEIYESHIYVSEYKRNHTLNEEQYQDWLNQSMRIISSITGIPDENIHMKLRKRKEGRTGQYQKEDKERVEFVVSENGLNFIVNLTEYLDTGLFLDHRITRQMVREGSEGRSVLNLFCYTGSFSVYAIAGGAASVTSIDLSKTYLNWTDRNVALNFPAYTAHKSVHADVVQWLKEPVKEKYDIIVMDPPTFSNSKRMEGILDVQRDHASLINHCLNRLNEGGVLYFSTNFKKFRIDEGAIKGKVKDITKATTPFDFAGRLHRYCFRITP